MWGQTQGKATASGYSSGLLSSSPSPGLPEAQPHSAPGVQGPPLDPHTPSLYFLLSQLHLQWGFCYLQARGLELTFYLGAPDGVAVGQGYLTGAVGRVSILNSHYDINRLQTQTRLSQRQGFFGLTQETRLFNRLTE